MKKTPTVTVAVSAFNEEDNITQFLQSVLMQKEEGFVIKQIVVISDGSTDKTVQRVKILAEKNPKITLIEKKERIGKSSHLNFIYKNLATDFLVQSDADVQMAHPHVVTHMVEPLLHNEKVGMCGGNPMPILGNTIWEKMTRVAFEPYLMFRSMVRGGNNAFSAVGQLLSFRKEFAQKITIPSDMVTNDIFAYFTCLTLEWEYRFAPEAIVHFQSPRRLKDVIRQNTRFQTGHNRMNAFFSSRLIDTELSIPRKMYISIIMRQYIKHPILSSLYYAINVYCKFRAYTSGSSLNATWPMAETTKKLYT